LELIIDGAAGMMQYLIQPIIVFILWITYDTSTILDNFQISNENAILYLLSSIILALFFQINIIIIFHVLELYLNTDYEFQFRKMLEGFEKRSTFWITES
jgi:fumarate reductase subunit D